MALVVNSNTTAMNALGNLNRTQRGLSKTFENISSGLRINNAADDSAGLAVAENLESEQMSLRQAQRNTPSKPPRRPLQISLPQRRADALKAQARAGVPRQTLHDRTPL